MELQDQFELPLVKDLLEQNENLRTQSQLQSGTKIPDSKIENIKVPYTIKNKLLMNEGDHNGIFYPAEEIKSKTLEANEKGLILDHKDTSNEGTSAWTGKVENVNWQDNGTDGPGMYGDLIIVDKPVAQKLAAGAKWGISPTIDYEKSEANGKITATDLLWKSFSFVITPAVRETMLNSKQEETTMAEPEKTVPYTQKNSKGKEETILQVNEETFKLLEARDTELAELKEFKETIETAKKSKLASELSANEFLIGRISEDELADREKALSTKSTEILSELVEIVGTHAELASYQEFVNAFMKKNKGATIAQAAKAWKKQNAGKEPDKEKKPDKEKENLEDDSDNTKDTDKKDEASLTQLGGDNSSRNQSELSKANPDVKDIDVGFYNELVKDVNGGVMLK